MKGDFSRFTFRSRRRYVGVLLQQGRVSLDADWNEQVEIERYQRRQALRDLVGRCGGPRDGAGFEIVVDKGGRGLTIGAGRYYADGLLTENFEPCAFTTQPFLPRAAAALADATAKPGRYRAYLDVWERHITAVEDPSLAEPALAGPDTTTRLQLVWQVRLGRPKLALDESAERPTFDIRTATGGYTGLENQLYLVEIHAVGEAAAGATFKWSRENGSVVVRLTAIADRRLTIEPDERLRPGDWLEVLDDALELDGRPGSLAQVREVEPGSGEVLLADSVERLADHDAGVDQTRHPKVRRWDGVGAVGETWQHLESGIEVSFGGESGAYRPGDYWTFAARPTIGAVIWPDGAQPALRTEHARCPLALLEVDRRGRWLALEDRRRLFVRSRA